MRCLCPAPTVLSLQVLPQELSPRLHPCKPGLGVEVGYSVPAPKVLSVISDSIP